MKNKVLFRILLPTLLVTLIAGGILIGCQKKDEPPVEVEEITGEIEQIEEEPEIIEEEVEEFVEEVDPHEGELQSFTSGLWLKEKEAMKRPLAVMLGNTVDALPQYGISEADIIYEMPVEGGITRLMAIFPNLDNVTKIGSIRSCRLYYAHTAVDYDAIYMHAGQAWLAENFLNSSAIDNISSLDGAVDGSFYRESFNKAPHNLFTTPDKIKAGIEKKDYSKKHSDDYKGHLVFANPDEEYVFPDSGAKKAILVKTGYDISGTWFTYDDKSGKYLASSFKRDMVDGQDNDRIVVDNIIFMNMSGRIADSHAGYLEMDTVGSGTGYYFADGKYTEITWSKDSTKSQTHYYLADGSDLSLKPGKTYICVIKSDNKDKITISDKNE